MEGPSTPSLAAATRRRHHRVACALDAGCRLQGPADGRAFTAKVVNLGMGGARVDLPERAPLPGRLTLTLPAIGGTVPDPAPIVLEARVVWTVKDAEGAPFPTGIQFTDMGDEARRRLYRYLSELIDRPLADPDASRG